MTSPYDETRKLRRLSRLYHRTPARGSLLKFWWGGNTKRAMVAEGEFLQDELCQHEIVHPYGIRSRPPLGAEMFTVSIGGASRHMVSFAQEVRGSAPDDHQEGDVVIWSIGGNQVRLNADGSIRLSTQAGSSIELKTNGTIEMRSPGGASSLDLKPDGSVEINGAGPAAARVGDIVTVTGLDSLGAPISATGVISSGSATVKVG